MALRGYFEIKKRRLQQLRSVWGDFPGYPRLPGCEQALGEKEPPPLYRAEVHLVKKVPSKRERKGKELREKPIRGFSRFESEVFQTFCKV